MIKEQSKILSLRSHQGMLFSAIPSHLPIDLEFITLVIMIVQCRFMIDDDHGSILVVLMDMIVLICCFVYCLSLSLYFYNWIVVKQNILNFFIIDCKFFENKIIIISWIFKNITLYFRKNHMSNTFFHNYFEE